MDCREMVLSNDVYDSITDFSMYGMENMPYDLCYMNIDNHYSSVYVNRQDVLNTEEYFYDYQSLPTLYGLMQVPGEMSIFDPANLIASGITQVQRSPLNLTGRGVVVCVIDTGIDYTNPVFLDANGESRILAIWDQTIQEGTPPEGFYYGTEYTREEINQALTAADPLSVVPSRDENRHGSALAAVAAGSVLNRGQTYVGAAPEAEFIIVKLKECKSYLRDFYLVPEGVPAYQENDIMLAVYYADSLLRDPRIPIVYCIGLGTNFGDHAGSSALSRYLSYVAVKRNRAVVVAGGNEGNAAHHYRQVLGPRGATLQNSANVEVRVSEGCSGFFLELWGTVPDAFNVTIRSPGGESIPPIRISVRQSITYGFVYERTRITVDSELVEPASGDELILFRIENPTPGIWNFLVEAVGDIYNGEFNMWLPISEFINVPVYFLEPTPYVTLTEPSLASNVITVSFYDVSNNSFYIGSGRGFGRTGAIKPDFAAPGVNVSTIYGKQTGSSYAAAITAGAVAQFMQWAVTEGNNSVVETREIKNYFIRGASRSSDLTYPNREWGFGRLNLVGTFDTLARV